MEKFQITSTGYQKLKAQLDKLKNQERPIIIKQIATARELGDLRENAEYHSAKERQGFIEAQIADLEDKSLRAEVVDITKIVSDKIKFGATVTLENLNNSQKITYKIVSEFEANIDELLISINSPVARALIGKEVGDDAEINTPGGIVNYEILEIKYL
ncbi:MAG: transcription elongation factor GreA [Alphaproteobacteria bacterium]|nr:transcription elongation factor GreA [Alphaproteobacteria bacterium]